MNTFESDLEQLPEPAVPEGLTAAITLRIARFDEDRAGGITETPHIAVAGTGRERWAWAAALTGLVVGLGTQVYRLAVGEATLNFTSSRIIGGLDGVVEMLPASPAVAVLGVGLLLFLAGFLDPVRGMGRA